MSSNPRRTGALTRPDPSGSDGLKLSTLTLRKGATFSSPGTSPLSSPTSTFKVPSLPRRSQTNLDDVVGAHVRRAALNIVKIEGSLAATDSEFSSGRRPFRDDSIPIPRGFLNHTVMGADMPSENERRVLRPRPRRSSQHHESDSGLGTSIASTGYKRKEAGPSITASAITRSVNTSGTESLPCLSERAVSRIHEHTLGPLLANPGLKDFRPIVLDCPRRIRENKIVCLRDLEKTLIFMAPVSQLLKDDGVWGVTYRSLCLKERSSSAKMYLDFCTTSIRCIQATVEYLTDREQTQPHDRPYSSGYFIDLFEQIRQHAEQMQEAREKLASGEDLDEMDVDPTDEVKLIGGLATSGRPAELVRVKKNGKAISLATGRLVEDLEKEKEPMRFKRSMSQQAADEEEIMRSMARRKKNAPPEELAPKPCTHVGCNKEFKRACDLTKHEKTHTRPFKCPHKTCKYFEFGWPTEKEMARHVNDKHAAAPDMFECHYKPCPYKSKRESNCKQHMEKAHGWTYLRSKVPKTKSKAGGSAKPTPTLNNLPTPSSDHTDSVMTPPEDAMALPFDNQMIFPTYPTDEEFNAALFDNSMIGDASVDFSPIDNGTPSTDAGQFNSYTELNPHFTEQFDVEDIYGAPVHVPTPPLSAYNKQMPEMFTNFGTTMCPPAPTHFSPSGHGNAMLYTPVSMVDVDEGFDDFQSVNNGPLDDDFTLFPPNNTGAGKSPNFDFKLFGAAAPSMVDGYSQPPSQDFVTDFNMDWTSTDFQGYPNQH
ncbi:hypothetical protein F4861DRAFT_490523 [Xylaria intraflava]|nr:hypothetical protein F4861DRAFT_490523 [Xylaria intraflava]